MIVGLNPIGSSYHLLSRKNQKTHNSGAVNIDSPRFDNPQKFSYINNFSYPPNFGKAQNKNNNTDIDSLEVFTSLVRNVTDNLPDSYVIVPQSRERTNRLISYTLMNTQERNKIVKKYGVSQDDAIPAILSDLIQSATLDLCQKLADCSKFQQIAEKDEDAFVLFQNGIIPQYLNILFKTPDIENKKEYCLEKFNNITNNIIDKDYLYYGINNLTDKQISLIEQMSSYLYNIEPQNLLSFYTHSYNKKIADKELKMGLIQKEEYFRIYSLNDWDDVYGVDPIPYNHLKLQIINNIIKNSCNIPINFPLIDKTIDSAMAEKNRLIKQIITKNNDKEHEKLAYVKCQTCYDVLQPEKYCFRKDKNDSNNKKQNGTVIIFSDLIMGKYISHLYKLENPKTLSSEEITKLLLIYSSEMSENIQNTITNNQTDALILKLVERCSEIPPEEILETYNRNFYREFNLSTPF